MSTRKVTELNPDKILLTLDTLSQRIEDRFPQSGLSRVCRNLVEIGQQAKARALWIAKPIVGLRIGVGVLIAIILAGLIETFMQIGMPTSGLELGELIQISEAGLNNVVLIGAAIFFLLTLETRIKRRRALKSLHELRAIAHIIDMHQLTKDPERLSSFWTDSERSPKRTMGHFELNRYLDYCSEMLALVGKLAALYVQNFPDSVALASVNEIETLASGLSRKIMQKLMILQSMKERPTSAGPRDRKVAQEGEAMSGNPRSADKVIDAQQESEGDRLAG